MNNKGMMGRLTRFYVRMLSVALDRPFLLAGGCATQGQKGPWDDFWKDLRGDNMEMRGFGMSEDKHSD